MMVDEQIQIYRTSFELTKPNPSNLAVLVLGMSTINRWSIKQIHFGVRAAQTAVSDSEGDGSYKKIIY